MKKKSLYRDFSAELSNFDNVVPFRQRQNMGRGTRFHALGIHLAPHDVVDFKHSILLEVFNGESVFGKFNLYFIRFPLLGYRTLPIQGVNTVESACLNSLITSLTIIVQGVCWMR